MKYSDAVAVAKLVSDGLAPSIELVDQAIEAVETALFCAEMSDDYSVTCRERAEIRPIKVVLRDYRKVVG